MGFDNECIVNIQSLAGEYFCPVCRLLVYPSEALQSQCTHLYCKPCLTYVVSTTQACPYDGYLVTEADSKLLVESNKSLAETIGKVIVHCLFHRSGCTWQGPLSECTAHCSGCAFGNSPVVCNRCGIQIIHRQVQEHAQNCPERQLPVIRPRLPLRQEQLPFRSRLKLQLRLHLEKIQAN
ncbi:hypothetical protein JRO89_XS13G0110400 [Xanthoceras sorbifolium]|uniref:RING-type domain-containing protein n=1 Tax=Xanthoceras sorbifolium TaxID=99658 RepID=A0ABQ8H7R6_9ROSI|nr:hypothetical protein JRO89_XS13G0110400 [Xanthoceras sorbifolium]